MSYSSYMSMTQLCESGFSNRQIRSFVEEGLLERVCQGYYWVISKNCEKPWDYKAIEICLSDPKAIICADSACYYQGLIPTEPGSLSVATGRNDRSRIGVNFPVVRHYVVENFFSIAYSEVVTDFGSYNIFDLDRSVCDCIRYRKDLDNHVFELIVERYGEMRKQNTGRIFEYARRLGMLKKVEQYF